MCQTQAVQPADVLQIESKHCAFVTFTSRLAAEIAAQTLEVRQQYNEFVAVIIGSN